MFGKWSLSRLKKIYAMPLMELLAKAHAIHAQNHSIGQVQVCSLISIKTGGCPEDCKYCAQSSRYQTSIHAQPMMSKETVLELARQAIARKATRICMGAAWREVKDNRAFANIIELVKEVSALGVEVCCTLGMLQEHHAQQLKEAGLYAYNHNLDTSENYYKTIITSRTYQDRLNTLDKVEKAGLSVCCGCILGMGESVEDRLEFLLTLSRRAHAPESVPINRLFSVPGTPLENRPLFSFWEMLRIVAMTRVVLPKTMIRLSTGRMEMSVPEQALCFFGGANSIFEGEKLLTVGNTPIDQDKEMFQILGLQPLASNSQGVAQCTKK